MKLPFLKFFPSDWLSDEKLRMCSLAARGMWIDFLCIMWKSPRRGFLESAQCVPISTEQLARAVGESADVITKLVAELEAAGVFSREDGTGVIFSRRVAKDAAFLAACSEAGRKGGGNPTFRGASKRSLKGAPKACPKPQKLRSTDVQNSLGPDGASEGNASESASAKKAKRRNALMDALAAVDGSDPAQVTGTAWSGIAKALAEIREVCPNVTPEEVQRRAQNYRQHMPEAKLTPNALSKWWAMCDQPPAPVQPLTTPARKYDLL